MRIVNPRRFTMACIVFAMILGLMGYGIYRGGVWVLGKVTPSTKQEMIPSAVVMEVEKPEPTVEVSSSKAASLFENLEWVSHFVVGCETEIVYEEGIASLTFEVIPSLALNYYPRQELKSRVLKQSLKFLQDVSKMQQLDELKRLDLLYVDQRLITSDNPIGEVITLTFNQVDLQETNWEQESWMALESYMME